MIGSKKAFLGGLALGVAAAVALSAVLVVTRGGSTSAPEAVQVAPLASQVTPPGSPAAPQVTPPGSPAAPQSPAATPLAGRPPSTAPAHGPLLFDLTSLLSSSRGQVDAILGNQQLDKVQVVGQAVQLQVWPTSRVLLPLPPSLTPRSFIAVMKVDLLGGKGAFAFSFHMDAAGEQQHAVQVYTDGTTEAALFAGAAGTRSLYQPVRKVPPLASTTVLTVAVNGPLMHVYIDGLEAGMATDGTLSRGRMAFKAGGADRGDPFSLRLSELKIYQPAPAPA
ncbi:MAG: hypothetical protein KGJ86_19180 [Chloroflexota bacterium]|nr:hypothetical protein [Chloroflexota bacterium]